MADSWGWGREDAVQGEARAFPKGLLVWAGASQPLERPWMQALEGQCSGRPPPVPLRPGLLTH